MFTLDQSAKYHEFKSTLDENPGVQLSHLEDIVSALSTFGFKIDSPLFVAHFLRRLPSDAEQEARVTKTTGGPKNVTREWVILPL